MTSLLTDPALVESEKELQRLALAPLATLNADATQVSTHAGHAVRTHTKHSVPAPDAMVASGSIDSLVRLLTASDCPLTVQLFHEVVDEHLGHAHSYDRFLASTASAASSSSPAASAASVHRSILALQHWIRSLLATSTIGSGADKADADRKIEVESVRSSAASLGCSSETASLLSSAFLARASELYSHARSRSVTSFAPWSLKDYDWSARVTLASSALSNLRTPLLLLTLTLVSPDGATRDVQLELDRAGLDKVLEQMAQVNQVVQEYSTTTAQ